MEKKEMEESERIVQYFLSHPETLRRLSADDGKDVLRLAGATLRVCRETELKNKCMELLYQCCFYLTLDIKELWNIFQLLLTELFIDSQAEITGNMDELYRFIFMQVLAEIEENQYGYLDITDSDRIILMTNQFLGGQHAPTRRILDYAYTLITQLKKSVMIINSAGFHCSVSDSICVPEFNFFEEYNEAESVEWKDIQIPFFQLSAFMPDISCYKEVLQKIYDLRPGLVYAVGDANLLADLCSIFTRTACLQCGTSMPVSMSQYLLIGRPLRDDDRARLKRMESYQQVIETEIDYEPVGGGKTGFTI